MSTALITDAMRAQLTDVHEQLRRDNPEADTVEAWWDGDSLLTSNPKIKTRVVPSCKKGGGV